MAAVGSRKPGRLLAIGIAALCGPLAACSDPLGPEMARLERARLAWEAARLEDYRFEYRTFCFCLNLQGLVEVRAGQVVGVTDLETGQPVTDESLDRYPTVDELFDTLAEWIGREPDEMEVTYHLRLGYPLTAAFDFDFAVADEEQAFQVSELAEIIEPL